MPGKAQYDTGFGSVRGRGRAGPDGRRPPANPPAENVVTFHGPMVLHTDLECLPIALVANDVWPFMNEIPRTWPIRNFTDFYEALAEWGQLESQAAQDVHNFLGLQQQPGRRIAWANQLGVNARLADYRVAGLDAHWSNRFWVWRLGLEWTLPGHLPPHGERQLESLRVAMEIIMLRLFPVSLEKHIALLKDLDSIKPGKGFPDPQRAQADALSLNLSGVTFTRPAYRMVALNSMRMKILANAAQAIAKRYPLQIDSPPR